MPFRRVLVPTNGVAPGRLSRRINLRPFLMSKIFPISKGDHFAVEGIGARSVKAAETLSRTSRAPSTHDGNAGTLMLLIVRFASRAKALYRQRLCRMHMHT